MDLIFVVSSSVPLLTVNRMKFLSRFSFLFAAKDQTVRRMQVVIKKQFNLALLDKEKEIEVVDEVSNLNFFGNMLHW